MSSVEACEATCSLLTFRTYGSWLHGDARGSIDRRRNRPGEALIPELPAFEQWERSRMRDPEMLFSEAQREVCTQAVRDHAVRRGWSVFALNVRTNHVHVVVEAAAKPEAVMNDFKAFATRALRKKGLVEADVKVWARGGSVRLLSTPGAITRACRYVVEGQGARLGAMPDEL